MFDSFDHIVDADPADLPATALAPFVAAAHGAREQCQLALVRGVGEVDATFEYRAAGHASAAAWLRALVPISEGDALRVVALARNLRRANLFAAAVASGELALARAEALLRPLANHRVRAAYLDHQATILAQSAGVATRDLGRLARQIEALLDADGPEPDHERPNVSTATIVQGDNGRWTLRADLSAEHGAMFSAELQAIVDQLRRDSELEDVDDVPKGARLRGAALAEMAARASASTSRNPAAPTATIIVPADTIDDLLVHDHRHGDDDCGHVDVDECDDDSSFADLGDDTPVDADGADPGDGDAADLGDEWDADRQRTTRPAVLEGTPITKNQLRRLLCDCLLHKVIVDSSGAILNLGRSQRTASKEQRLYLALRDGGCVFPGCHQPPNRCRAHHIRWWRRDHGPTDIDNLALCCDRHHELIHTGTWRLDHHGDGHFTWTHRRTGRTEHRQPHQHWLLEPV